MKKVLKFKKYTTHILNVQVYIKNALKKEFCIEYGELKTRNKIFVRVKAMLLQNYCITLINRNVFFFYIIILL